MKFTITPPPYEVELNPGDCLVPDVNPSRGICAYIRAVQGAPLEESVLALIFKLHIDNDGEWFAAGGISSRYESVRPTWFKDIGLRKTDRRELQEHINRMASKLMGG